MPAELSKCCGAPVVAEGRTTRFYRCTGCGRPASMLQPVTFGGDGDDEARRVTMRPVSEDGDEW